jgi:hypothetical protein
MQSATIALFASAVALMSTACASPRPAANATSTTSAEVAARSASPAVEKMTPEPSAPAPSHADPDPAGQLVCRANVDGNDVRLFLDWDKETARGMLRSDAPSGMIHRRAVKAERYNDRVIVDEPEPSDLTVHVATLVDRQGAKKMQLGDVSQTWWDCK